MTIGRIVPIMRPLRSGGNGPGGSGGTPPPRGNPSIGASCSSLISRPELFLSLLCLGLVACNDRNQPSESEEPGRDSDDDHVPNAADECPDEAAATASGCAPETAGQDPTLNDRDGDGIPDDQDQCPDESHPALPGETGATGCPPDLPSENEPDYGVNDFPDAGVPGPQLLEGDEAGFFLRESAPRCPHISVTHNKLSFLSWQEGTQLFLGTVTLAGLTETLHHEERFAVVPPREIDLCHVARSVLSNQRGQLALLWPRLVLNNRIALRFQLRGEAAPGEILFDEEVAEFFLEDLGSERRDTVASMDSFANGDFIVVWVDRDHVWGRRISAAGEFLEEPLEIFAPGRGEALRVRNPSVAIERDERFVVTWQEGTEQAGRIVGRRFTQRGGALTPAYSFLEDETEEGRFPIAAGAAEGLRIFAWIVPVQGGQVRVEQDRQLAHNFYFGSGEGQAGDLLFSPAIALTNGLLTLAWLEEDRREQVQLRVVGVGDPTRAAEQAFDGIPLDSVPHDARIQLASQGQNVWLVYPSLRSSALFVQGFEWR
jgi:hypothetical protein